MEIKIKIYNPYKKLIYFIKHNKMFWRLKVIKKKRLGMYDIEYINYKQYVIRHILTGEILDYEGFGCELKQNCIDLILKRVKL